MEIEELEEEKKYFSIMWTYVSEDKKNLLLTILMLILTTVLTVLQ